MSDRDAEFTAFVVDRRQLLLRTAYLLCGSWIQAEDVVQIALSKLYVAWPRVQPTRGAYAYARRIVDRTAVDEWRRPWRREVSGGVDLLDDVAEAGGRRAAGRPGPRRRGLKRPRWSTWSSARRRPRATARRPGGSRCGRRWS